MSDPQYHLQITQAQGLNNTTPIRVYNTTERRLHAHTHTLTHTHTHTQTHTHTHTHTHTRNKNSQTPKKLRKNTRKPLPCKYYLPTTLDTYKQRHRPQGFTHFYISHTCSLSHRKPNAQRLRKCTHTQQNPGGRPTPAENRKFRRLRRKD